MTFAAFLAVSANPSPASFEAISSRRGRALFAAGIFISLNWLVWWLLTRLVIGLRHPPAIVDEPITPGRRAVAVAAMLLFLLTFVAVPIRL